MDEEEKNGYIAGALFLLAAAILGVNIDLSNTTSIVITAFFGITGLGSLIRPKTIGQIADQLLQNAGENMTEDSRNNNSQTVINYGDNNDFSNKNAS